MADNTLARTHRLSDAFSSHMFEVEGLVQAFNLLNPMAKDAVYNYYLSQIRRYFMFAERELNASYIGQWQWASRNNPYDYIKEREERRYQQYFPNASQSQYMMYMAEVEAHYFQPEPYNFEESNTEYPLPDSSDPLVIRRCWNKDGMKILLRSEIKVHESIINEQILSYQEQYSQLKEIDVYRITAILIYIGKMLCLYPVESIENPTEDFSGYGIPSVLWNYIYPVASQEADIGYNTYVYAFVNDILLLSIPNRIVNRPDRFLQKEESNYCPYEYLRKELQSLSEINDIWTHRHVFADMYQKVISIPDLKTKELLIFVLWYLIHEVKKMPLPIATEFKSYSFSEDMYTPQQSGILSRHLKIEHYRSSILSNLQFYSILSDNSVIKGLLTLGDDLLTQNADGYYWGEDDVFDFLVYMLVYLTV